MPDERGISPPGGPDRRSSGTRARPVRYRRAGPQASHPQSGGKRSTPGPRRCVMSSWRARDGSPSLAPVGQVRCVERPGSLDNPELEPNTRRSRWSACTRSQRPSGRIRAQPPRRASRCRRCRCSRGRIPVESASQPHTVESVRALEADEAVDRIHPGRSACVRRRSVNLLGRPR